MIGSGRIGGQRANIDPNHAQYPNNISTSCNLKEIGNRILQHHLVVRSYNIIRGKVYKLQVPIPKEEEYNRLQAALLYGWGIVVDNCFNKEIDSDLSLNKYYIINQAHIDDINNQCPLCPAFGTAHARAAHYLSIHVNMDDVRQASVVNHQIVLNALSNTQNLAIKLNNRDNQDSARTFLAKIKLSLEVERDWAKVMLFYYNNEVQSRLNNTVLTEINIQENETLKLYTSGAFMHYKMGYGNYDDIARMLETQYLNQGVTVVQLVNAFKVILRSSTPQITELQNDQISIDRIKPIVELMFFTEVKRNSAALLTNAMFWDLVAEGVYQVTDIEQKMPVAMQRAVIASITIDKMMGVNRYDYRADSKTLRAEELNIKDGKLILDWFLQRNLENIIRTMNIGNTVNDLDELVPDFVDEDFVNEHGNDLCTVTIPFAVARLGQIVMHAEGTIILQAINNSIQYTIGELRVDKIAFFDIIDRWYGLQIPDYNEPTVIVLKAAAEPQDPDEDPRDQYGSKVLANDSMDIQLDIELTTKAYIGSELQNLYIPMQYDMSCLGEVTCSAYV